jgi:NAD(P)-dependent dehydrogenase (short-subunit alcohol dehydrogenase family)
LLGSDESGIAAMETRLTRDGHHVDSGSRAGDLGAIDGLVLQAESEELGVAFLELADRDVRSVLCRFVDMIGDLQQGLKRVREHGSIVVVTSRGYLGAWGGAHEMAFSAATVALMRSVAVECLPRRVRANVIAVEFAAAAGAPEGPSDRGSVADLAAFLLSEESHLINGEVLLASGGRSLQMREARDRRVKMGSSEKSRPT